MDLVPLYPHEIRGDRRFGRPLADLAGPHAEHAPVTATLDGLAFQPAVGEQARRVRAHIADRQVLASDVGDEHLNITRGRAKQLPLGHVPGAAHRQPVGHLGACSSFATTSLYALPRFADRAVRLRAPAAGVFLAAVAFALLARAGAARRLTGLPVTSACSICARSLATVPRTLRRSLRACLSVVSRSPRTSRDPLLSSLRRSLSATSAASTDRVSRSSAPWPACRAREAPPRTRPPTLAVWGIRPPPSVVDDALPPSLVRSPPRGNPALARSCPADRDTVSARL